VGEVVLSPDGTGTRRVFGRSDSDSDDGSGLVSSLCLTLRQNPLRFLASDAGVNWLRYAHAWLGSCPLLISHPVNLFRRLTASLTPALGDTRVESGNLPSSVDFVAPPRHLIGHPAVKDLNRGFSLAHGG
jgi:hypothetical protein